MTREMGGGEIEEVPKIQALDISKEKPPGVLNILLENLIDKNGNLTGFPYNTELTRILAQLGFEEPYELFYDQKLMRQVKEVLQDKKSVLLDRIKLIRLLCDISDDLFEESEEKESFELLKFLRQSTEKDETKVIEKIYASAAISESGFNSFFPGPKVIETGHEPFEKYSYHDPSIGRFNFQFDSVALDKINYDRGDHQYFETVLPIEVVKDFEGPCVEGDFIVSKLSPKLGGIYSLKGDLIGWFNLPLTARVEKTLVKIKVESVSMESAALLTDRAIFNNPEEIALSKIMESLPVRIEIKKHLGIELAELPLRVQRQFLSFTNLQESGVLKRVRRFLEQALDRKSWHNRIVAFLSLEYGEQMAERILFLSENLGAMAADQIFAKYSELVQMINEIDDFLYKQLGRMRNYDDMMIKKISENLLSHGKNLLVKFTDQVQEAKNQSKTIDNQTILEQLEGIKAEILLFASAFKAVSVEQIINLEEIKGTRLEIMDSSKLAEPTKAKMIDIFKENRGSYPSKLLRETLKEFTEALNSTGKKFYILTHGQEIVSFIRFDKLPNGNLYAGSLNVRPEIKGSAIGSAVLKAALDKEAREQAIEAVVYEKNPMLKHYLNDFGFQMANEIPDYHGTGEKFFKLERPMARLLKKAA